EQPAGAHLSDERVLREWGEGRVQRDSECCDVLDERVTLDDIQVGECDRRASWMPGVRVAVAQHPRAAVPEGLADTRTADDDAERKVPGRDALRSDDEVGLDAVAVAAEPRAETAEAGDHLVGDEQHVVIATESLHLRPVAI